MAAAAPQTRARTRTKVKDWFQEQRSLAKRSHGIGGDVLRHARIPGVAELRREGGEEEQQRRERFQEIARALGTVKRTFRGLKSSLESALGPRSEASPPEEEAIRRMLERLEDLIRAFKGSMRDEYADLLEQDRMLSRELTAFQQRCATWDKETPEELARRVNRGKLVEKRSRGPASQNADPNAAPMSDTEAEEEAPERTRRTVAAVDAEMARLGGANGGWLAEQHETFLRLWAQAFASSHTGAELRRDKGGVRLRALVTAAATALPELPAEDVRDHARWYVEHLGLQARKRDAVAVWRRDVRRTREVAKKAEDDAAVELRPAADPEEDQRRRLLARKKKAEVQAWRKQKAVREAAIEKAKADEARQRRLQGIRRRQELEAKREKIAIYQLEKEKAREHQQSFNGANSARTPRSRRVDLHDRVRQDLDRAKAKAEEEQKGAVERGRAAREAAQKRTLDSLAADALAVANSIHGEGEVGDFDDEPPLSSASSPGVKMAWLGVTRDPNRLTARTQAFRRREYTPEELDEIEERREGARAHERMVPLGARDRVFVGRAMPSWRQGM